MKRAGAILTPFLLMMPALASAQKMRFSPDGKERVAGDEFGTVKLWRIGEEMPGRQVMAHGDTATAVGFSPDGKGCCSGLAASAPSGAFRPHILKLDSNPA